MHAGTRVQLASDPIPRLTLTSPDAVIDPDPDPTAHQRPPPDAGRPHPELPCSCEHRAIDLELENWELKIPLILSFLTNFTALQSPPVNDCTNQKLNERITRQPCFPFSISFVRAAPAQTLARITRKGETRGDLV